MHIKLIILLYTTTEDMEKLFHLMDMWNLWSLVG